MRGKSAREFRKPPAIESAVLSMRTSEHKRCLHTLTLSLPKQILAVRQFLPDLYQAHDPLRTCCGKRIGIADRIFEWARASHNALESRDSILIVRIRVGANCARQYDNRYSIALSATRHFSRYFAVWRLTIDSPLGSDDQIGGCQLAIQIKILHDNSVVLMQESR